jgi:hypothetical protein
MFRSIALIGSLLLSCSLAVAQQPTQAQRDALRSACRSDFMANCAGVQPGGRDAFMCLVRNSAKLSPACGAAVSAVQGPAQGAPATAAEPPAKPPVAEPTSAPATPSSPPAAARESSRPGPQQLSAVRAACRSDFMANCAGVKPGGAAALQCLQRNSERLSGACQNAVAAIGGSAPGVPPPPAAIPPPPTVAPLPPLPPLRPREALAILRICAPEARLLCNGVPLGGGRLLGCLAANAASLSPVCYSALAAAGR